MKTALFLLLGSSLAFGNFTNLKSFEADFTQTIVDEKKKEIVYKGDVKAAKPSYALWVYTKPVEKKVYVLKNKVIMVEPELEQAVIKTIDSKFDFFSLMQNAKKTDEHTYEAIFHDKLYTIHVKQNDVIDSIDYVDEFDNKVTIAFTHQKVNQKIDLNIFNPYIPQGFDIIRDK